MFIETQDPPPTADEWTELKNDNVGRVKAFKPTIFVGRPLLKYVFTRVIPDEGIIEYQHCSGKHWLAFRAVSDAKFRASITNERMLETDPTLEFSVCSVVGGPNSIAFLRECNFSVSIEKLIAAPMTGSELMLRIRSILASNCYGYSRNSKIFVEMDGGSHLRDNSVLWRSGSKRLHVLFM